jgi:hypothetical protein
MVKMTFEEWWQEHYEAAFSNVGGALRLAFKEVAEKAWEAAYNNGYEHGCSTPGLFCTCGRV